MKNEFSANLAMANTAARTVSAHESERARWAAVLAPATRKPAARKPARPAHGDLFAVLFVSAVIPAFLFAVSTFTR